MSLKRITLKDFVIIKHLELDFHSGFSVLSGETGAGKSILIDAIQLALGQRADTAFIREGAPKTEIVLEFEAPKSLEPWLNEQGFDFELGQTELLIKRIIDTAGKSRAWINASPATATQLRELGEQLIDIHGQHAWQSLTRASAVRALLDAYAGVSIAPVSTTWTRWRASIEALHTAQHSESRLQSERERLLWQISELERLSPQAGEWEDLNTQHTRLANAQTLIEVANRALGALDEAGAGRGDSESGEGSPGASYLVSIAHSGLQSGAHHEPHFSELCETLESAGAQIADVVHSLQNWLARTDLDPARLAQLDERLSLWVSLARRYKVPPAELLQMLEAWRAQLHKLDEAVNIQALEEAERAAFAQYTEQAKRLGAARARAAPQLARAITEAMQGLGMQGGTFVVQIDPLEEPSAFGLEEVSFLVAAHAGATPRAVAKVASGGELSRISLAIAVTTSQLGEAQTLIFDEVDSGVGGAVAQTVGELMRRLGRDRQVLAVTHLPQVAACADHHWVVSKALGEEGTLSDIQSVEGEARVAEIARMLGGEQRSQLSSAHAREMLEHSHARTSPHEPHSSADMSDPTLARSAGAKRLKKGGPMP